MAKKSLSCLVALLIPLLPALAFAHFQVLFPTPDILVEGGPKKIELDLHFTHPMAQGPVMDMGAPKAFGVLVGEKKIDLLASLKPVKLEGKAAYRASFEVKAPGNFVFYLEPAPYYEPAEKKLIIHYTKTVVPAYGVEEGWDNLVGFPIEIKPLTRPYGLWAGNLFQGVVLKGGQPVPGAEVEVEYYNTPKVKIPSDPFTTQVVKADGGGVFTYAMPRAGWWGFTALTAGEKKLPGPDGQPKEVELGAVIWVKTVDMK